MKCLLYVWEERSLFMTLNGVVIILILSASSEHSSPHSIKEIVSYPYLSKSINFN